ncbi:MAG: pilus assembly protein PilM [Nitrospirae bacterium]|nr:pilus assembly protein PilM [Nitrospirota bacterium]MBI5695031.1 pilus assembly protein PilM [Nitrospirota bacterium]
MSLLFGRGPGIGLEVGQRALRAAKLAGRTGERRVEWAGGVELPPGLLLDSFTEPNITDMQAFADTVRGVFSGLGRMGKGVNVALPDYVSRVSILDFDTYPGKSEEVEKMLRWRLRKLVPFDVDQAALRFQFLGRFGAREKFAHRFLVSIIKADILDQYSQAFGLAGLRPEHIEIASFSVWNLYHDHILKAAGGGANFALMNVFDRKLTVIVFDQGVPHFLRLKDLGKAGYGEDDSRLDASRVVRELNASLVYYKENYAQTPVGRVFITGDSGWVNGIANDVRENSSLDATVLDPGKVVDGSRVQSAPGGLPAYTAACGAALEH